MAENGAHFSGEGHLIEGEIEGDLNKTIRPIVCDADGHLIIDLDASTITIGTVDQGASGTDPWSIKIDQTGTNNDVDATVTNFPANQNVTVTNGAGAAAVNIQDGGNSITVDGTVTVIPSGTQDVRLVATSVIQPVSGTVTVLQGTTPWTVNGTVTSNIGTTGGLALDATLTNSTQKTQIVQGGNTAVVDGTGDLQVDVNNFPATVAVTQSTSPWVISGAVTNTPPANASTNLTQVGGSAITEGQKPSATSIPVVIASDQSAIAVTGTVTTSPNVNVHDGTGTSISSTGSSLNVNVTNTVPVTGAFFPATQPVSGTVTVVQPTGTNLHAVLDSGSTTVVTGNVTVVQPTGTNLHTVVDNFPATQVISPTFGGQVTYSFAGGVTLGLLATDVFTINGSNTKIIRITEIELFLLRTTAGTLPISFIRRSANNTGGTSATFGAIAQDPNDPVSSGNVTLYTANPTALGASPGNVGVSLLSGNALGTDTQSGYKIEFLYDGIGKGVMLRNANQHIACNFGGTTVAGGVLYMNITWTEE